MLAMATTTAIATTATTAPSATTATITCNGTGGDPLMNKLPKLRRHASRVHFAKIHFGSKKVRDGGDLLVIVSNSLV